MSSNVASSTRNNSLPSAVPVTVPDLELIPLFAHLTLLQRLKLQNSRMPKAIQKHKNEIKQLPNILHRHPIPCHPFTSTPLTFSFRVPTYTNDWDYPSIDHLLSTPTITLSPPTDADPEELSLPYITSDLPLRNSLYAKWTYPCMGLPDQCTRINVRCALTKNIPSTEPPTPTRESFPEPSAFSQYQDGQTRMNPLRCRAGFARPLDPVRLWKKAGKEVGVEEDDDNDDDPLAARFPFVRKPQWPLEALVRADAVLAAPSVQFADGEMKEEEEKKKKKKGKLPAPVHDLRTSETNDKGKSKETFPASEFGAPNNLKQGSSLLYSTQFGGERDVVRRRSDLKNEATLPSVSEGSELEDKDASVCEIVDEHRRDCNGCKLERKMTFAALVEQVLDDDEDGEENEAQREIYEVLGALL